ncbi:MAG: hypothetical protein ACYCVY_11210 [Acidiferrobacteraceae bacterium]
MELKKKLVLGHGDKGGVGKSTLISAAVDFAIEQYGQVRVVEGDETIDDVARRFDGVPGVSGCMVDLARPDASEEAVIQLFEELERAGLPDVVVINTPASASATLDRQAAVFIDAAHDLGYSVRVGWMLGPDENSAGLSMQSELCKHADRKIAIVNERFGDGKRFAWAKHPARAAWLQSGGLESALPLLTDTAASALREHAGRYSVLAAPGSPLSTITRKYVGDWVRKTFAGPVGMLFADERK